MVQEILLSKKFILVILFAILGTVLVITDKTSADIFFKFMELIAGGYLVGNVSDKINDTRANIEDIKNG
jgi:hypothetical protein